GFGPPAAAGAPPRRAASVGLARVPVPMASAPAPAPEALLDHRGRERGRYTTDMTYEQDRLGLAFHEAGHAVLGMAYGMHVHKVEVIAWLSDPYTSHVTGCTTTEVSNDCDWWEFAAQSAAGTIAQVSYLMAYGLWTPDRAAGCEALHDRDLAIDVLTERGYRIGTDSVPAGGRSWAMVQGMARRKVTHLWPHIQTVAHALFEQSVLTGDDITGLTGLVNREVAA
ncbi:hypothetical protein, partial [Streptomyces olivaceus]|uniref:hypothetical protein n=1 Tax=Streptomyces olivaceus TaxID=47716 RepID=UPI003662F92D